MFYRRKIILALLDKFGGELDKIHFQKLLFLFSQKQAKSEYDFVPYKFGCFSFSANADMSAMVKSGILTETDTKFIKNGSEDYISGLKPADAAALSEIAEMFGKMDMNEVKRFTYLNYPYYATNSEIAKKTLTGRELIKVEEARAHYGSITLFTIGYEGISLEEYFNRLIKNDVKMLVDVRKNALSMKFGFSKSQLSKYCSYLSIEYIHIPQVGIESDKRQELNSQADYDMLFEVYKKELPQSKLYQYKIFDLLLEKRRVALTCFEADINKCHRKHLAEAIADYPEFEYELRHI